MTQNESFRGTLKLFRLKSEVSGFFMTITGKDQISQNEKSFIKEMETVGIKVCVVEYEEDFHGFIESNNPEGISDE